MHEELYLLLQQLKADASTTDLEELANRTYALKECKKFIEDARKELNKLLTVYEAVTGAVHTAFNKTDSIKTPYCTCLPNCKMIASLPNRKNEPEKFAELMTYLAIPEHLWNQTEEDDEVVRAHWPGLVAFLSRELAAGKPMPPGIDPNRTYTQFTCTTRGRKAPDEVVE